ncbi:MlaD family protein [Nocardioides marmotae]|uniref:MCE family protein n=1 Tax=Nocardioides marmotae TaxID=2663857 RepID=A0A6I3J026_9ACTN|nr:MlaD family protein [Nocardioides marmotae]MCR6031168.1 MCE family protein [Gordonia jinghuaiqii]MBC9731885.1 MCE family protein [Nocardioides marmotae]MTB83005.1 MCE family protein [Nocardioides marmotae]MTB94807.1 MCE family protein [Nocardioides marmotae]QKE01204.1 MCE family protein [Nocardioides marmotae]
MTWLRAHRPVLSVVGLVAAFAVCVTYLVTVVLDVPLTGRADQVSVQLPRTGGLFEGSPATYRGVRVGTVTDVELDPEAGVVATIALRPGVEVPRATRAAVRSLSPVGEQFLDFQPDEDGGPFLRDGDVVRASAADVPVSMAAAAAGLDNLLDRVDGRDVRVLLREIAAATQGTGGDLETLLVSLDEVSTALDDAWPQTDRLLRNGERVGELLSAHRADLAGFSESARRFASWLEGFDPEFRRILRRAPDDLDTMGVLADDLAVDLPPALVELVGLTDLLADRDPHVRQLTRMLGYGTSRFASAFNNGWLDIDLLLQGQEQCSYGTPHRHPSSTDRKPLNRDGRCAMDDAVWRGAEHAPPPLDR